MIKQQIQLLTSDEQDPKAIEKILPKVQELLTRDEVVEYIGVQKKPIVTLSPDAIVLTNKRFMAVRPKMFGMNFEDFPWREVKNIHMSEQILSATISCTTVTGHKTEIDSIPKKQARKIYAYAQEVEEQAHHGRRQIELESLRAAAGNVVVQAGGQQAQPPALPVDDPMQVLGKLKKMLEAGLIEQSEYDAKKAEILSKI